MLYISLEILMIYVILNVNEKLKNEMWNLNENCSIIYVSGYYGNIVFYGLFFICIRLKFCK